MKKMYLRSLMALFLLFGSQLYSQLTCFSDWQYVQTVKISTLGGGQLLDFAARFTLDTQSLIAAGKMNADGSDLRFADTDCCTELPYWIMQGLNTNTTIIFIRIPQLTNPKNISMYYGNVTASPAIHTIDSVLFTIGNDNMGTDTLIPGLTVASQEYNFPFNIRTVRWRIWSSDSGSVTFKLSNDTNMVLASSTRFPVPAGQGFHNFIWEGAASNGGHPGIYSDTTMPVMSNCAPNLPCPGSCGDMVYEPGNLGLFQPLDRDTCGAVPNFKIWYRKSAFFEPNVSKNGAEFDRNLTITAIALGNTTFCSGDSTLLFINDPGANSYQWYVDGQAISGATDTSYFAKSAGDHACVASFGLCKTVASTAVTTFIPFSGVNLGQDLVICSDTGFLLDAGPGYAAYNWSDNSTGQTFSVSASGMFWVTAWDTNFCSTSDSIYVLLQVPPIPVIAGTDSVLICRGDSISLDAYSPNWFAYIWSRNGETSSNLFVDTVGTFSVMVFDSLNCSGVSNSVNVQFYPSPTLNIGPDMTGCMGDTFVLDAGMGWTSILWPDNSTGQTFSAVTTGNFDVEVVDGNGCTVRDSALITLDSGPPVSIGTDVQICPGTTASLTPNQGFTTYLWSTGANSMVITVGAGAYQLTVTNGNGCPGFSNIVNVSEYQGIQAPVISGDASGLTSSSAPNYQWNLDGNPISGATNPLFTPQSAGRYTVTVNDPNGCGSISSNPIDVTLGISGNDIPEGFSPNGDGTNDRFEILNIAMFQQNSLTVINRWGTQVFKQSPYTNGWSGIGPGGDDLPDGTYYYILDLGIDAEPVAGYIIINR